MNDPNNPLGWQTWRRGGLLGLRLAAVFFGATVMAWLLMGLLGWSAGARALCAMGIGPVIAVGLIAGWWVFRKPKSVGGVDLTGSKDRG